MATALANTRQVPTVKMALNSPPELTTTELRDSPFVFGCPARVLQVDLEALDPPWTSAHEKPQNEGDGKHITIESTCTVTEKDEGSAEVEEELDDEQVEKAYQDAIAKFSATFVVFQTDPVHEDDVVKLGSPNATLIQQLRDFVAEDAVALPTQRVDMVSIGPNPLSGHLKAIQGLSPTHLKMWAGWDESVRMDAFAVFTKQWSLQSLEILGEYEGFSFYYPSLFANLKYLTLESCHGFQFNSPYPLVSLTHLNLNEGDAMDAFIWAVHNIPGFQERLTTLSLSSTGQEDLHCFSIEIFAKRLSRCVALKDLTLSIGVASRDSFHLMKSRGKDLGPYCLAALPPNVENLAFHSSSSPVMLANLDRWIERAADPTWLPSLKSLTMRPDCGGFHPLRGLPGFVSTQNVATADQVAQYESKVKVISNLLQKRSPPVQVVY